MSQLCIFIDRFKEGQTLFIEETTAPDFLEIQEQELRFPFPIIVKGKTYLSDDHLIVQLQISTEIMIPCAICNELFSLPIRIENFTHVEPVAEIINHIFDYTQLLRETILLEVPTFAECHEGRCPERPKVAKYLRKPQDKTQDPVYFPFTNL
ncbi:MAG: hypothetical protein KGZ39_08360 [Simkania sp.]|nr:hypothetical protein [Simkania sp.]